MTVEFIELEDTCHIKVNEIIIETYKKHIRGDKSFFWVSDLKEFTHNLKKTETLQLLNITLNELPEWYELYLPIEEMESTVVIHKEEDFFQFYFEINHMKWIHPFSIHTFVQYFNKHVKSPEWLKIGTTEDDVIYITSKVIISEVKKKKLLNIITELKKITLNEYREITQKLLIQYSVFAPENGLTKTIYFKKEHQKAGLAILQNFGNLLTDKYPEENVAFSLKQKGLKVTMVIEHPDGEKETVEDYLNRYGLVVTGKIAPEEFSNEPLVVLDLKRQLIQVESDLKWSNEKQNILTNTINGQDRQIENLSSQLVYFQDQLSNALSNKHVEISYLLDLLNRGDNQTESLIQPLINSINNENIQETQSALEHIKNEDSSLFQKLNDFVLNTMASTGANAPAWIDYLSKLFP